MTIKHIFTTVLLTGTLACGGAPDISHKESDPPDGRTVMSGPYLDEDSPGSEAVIFAPGTVSIEGRYEYALSIHPEGDRVLFTVEVPEEGASVWTSSIENGSWTSPLPVDLSGGAHSNEMEAFFSSNGKRVFFAPFTKGMDVRIWSADLTPSGFANPQPLGEPIARDPSFFPVQANDGSLFYTNLAERAIYRASFDDGRVTGVEPAGLEIGGHAFPSPDGTFMVLDSASLNSDEQRDIYVAFRNDDGGWGHPHPLGPEVNTEHSETCPTLSPDGELLFFSRYNEPGQLSNIYWISTTVISDAALNND